MYNVIWIDDEYDKMTTFMEECEVVHGLHLVPFRTRREGMEELERNLDKYQAVLLDAKMFNESANETPDVEGLTKALRRLDELSLKKAIPRFISTGQPDLMSNSMFQKMVGEFYIKGTDDEKLFQDMIIAIEQTDRIQIRKMYQPVFDAISTLKLPDDAAKIISDIFLSMHYPANYPNFNPALYYNQLRQVLEYVFRACLEVELLPNQCVQGTNVNLNQSSLYLAGWPALVVKVRYGEPEDRVVPEYIEGFILSLLEFGNVQSHTVQLSPTDQTKIEGIFRAKQSDYIIFGLTMYMCEVLTWFAKYIPNHSNKPLNRQMCHILLEANQYNGKVLEPKQDSSGMWHCEDCVLALKTWTSGDMVRLKDVTKNNNESKKKYAYFAKYDIVP